MSGTLSFLNSQYCRSGCRASADAEKRKLPGEDGADGGLARSQTLRFGIIGMTNGKGQRR